jgi:hypothetical protein
MAALVFITGFVWGSLSAQFLVQILTSLIISFVYLAGLTSNKVPRTMNAAGCGVSLLQAMVFAALFVAGSWLASSYVDFISWNAASIASLVSFLTTLLITARQVPGKVLLAKLSAQDKWFLQAVVHRPREERVELAWKYRASPSMATLYPPSPRNSVAPMGETNV